MFMKLGALALFASLAVAFDVFVSPEVTAINDPITVTLAGVVSSDTGEYKFVLVGPAENQYSNPIGYEPVSPDQTTFTFTIPEGTPDGYDYYVKVARNDGNPNAVHYDSEPFTIESLA